MTERFFDLVVPLAQGELPFATAMRTTETTDEAIPVRAWSGAVSQLGLFDSSRPGDVDSTNKRRTPTTSPMPGCRASTTATRTTTTRTTSIGWSSSADETAPCPADFSFTELVQAYEDCRRHKRNKSTALAFEIDCERNLCRLYDELQEGSYRPGRSISFVITRPKPREVWAAEFRDRIVHHLLYNKVAPRFHAGFIADSCACIPGRGTLYGIKRLEAKIRSITQNWSRPAHYLKLDLANFFVSIDKRIVFEKLARRITEPWWLDLAGTILFHDPRQSFNYHGDSSLLERVPSHKRLTNQPSHLGLPIGNLSSQFFANILLDVLDQFAKHQLGARYYIRYVDDIVLLHESPQWLNDAKAQIEVFLADNLNLRINPAKTILQPVDRGVDFVGQVIRPWHRTMRRRTFNEAMSRAASIDAGDLLETANSYFGLFRQASHSHADRARLSNVLRYRGHCISGDLTKTYRKSNQFSKEIAL
ncbi:MAG: RNA-directed DNA polymerase [Sterolibacterium sp.]